MKECITKVRLQWASWQEAEGRLASLLPGYQIKYSSFTGLWEIKNKDFVHSLWYYEDKESKLKTRLAKHYRESLVVMLPAIAVMAALILNKMMPIGMLFLVVIIRADNLVERWKPEYKLRFDNEHRMLLEVIQSLNE